MSERVPVRARKGMRGRSAVCGYCNEEVWFVKTGTIDSKSGEEVEMYMWKHVLKDPNGQMIYEWMCTIRSEGWSLERATYADPELPQIRLI